MRIPIILRLAGRYVRRRLLQSVLFVIGVALGVAVVIAIDLANGSASRAFNLSAESITGRATHQIIGSPSGLPSDFYVQLRVDLGLRDSAPVVEDYAQVIDLGDRPLRVLGVDPFAEPPFRSYLTEVRVQGETQTAYEGLAAFISQPNTVLISARVAERYGIQAGDTITVQPAAEQVEMRVVGLLQTADEVSAQALDNLILTDIATAQEIVGRPGTISRVDLILPEGYDLDLIRAILPAGATITTPRDQQSALGQMTAAFELNLQALSLLALVVGVFLIYNTVSFSVVQRRPILGILRALGATRRQIFALILSEALLLGFVGTIFGLALGIIFGRALVGLVAQTISDLYFAVDVQRVTVDPLTLLIGAGIGIGVSLVSALVPSIDATSTPPAGSMRRSALEERARRLIIPITGAALVLILAGIALLNLPTNSLIISFGALFAVIVGGALFTPAALIVGMRAVTPLTDRLFGVVGRMSPRAVSRSLSRTSVAVAALTVAVSVIVGVSVMIGSFRNTVSDWLDTTLGADIYVSPPQVIATRATADVDPAVADVIAGVEGVAQVISGRSVNVTAPDFPDLPPVTLNVGSEDVTGARRRFVWSTVNDADYFAALKTGAVIMVSEPFAFRRGITQANNTLTLLTDRGEQAFTVIGVYYDYSTDQGSVLMADDVYRQFYDDPYISTLAAFITPGADVNAVLDGIRTALAGSDLIARSNVTLRASVFEVFERTFAITGALQLLAVVVAFVGILSALMALQLEQTRQYGVMRAIGMTGRQLWNYTLIQTGLMGITAGLLAMPVGVALAIILIYVINVRSFGWTMQLTLSPGEFALSFGVAVIAALAAGVYPARKISQLVTAVALRNE
ncbi:MAG: ABC transporter permease [Anaerolinea sp.]|nr:ABC transporter permease [Anaerolinea sp.]